MSRRARPGGVGIWSIERIVIRLKGDIPDVRKEERILADLKALSRALI
jgi:hypothetical protein